MLTGKAVHCFLASREDKMVSEDTIALYRWALRKLEQHFPYELPQKREEIQQLLRSNSDLSLPSLRTLWDRLRVFWAWLVDQDHCDSNPMVDMPIRLRRRKLPRILTEDETKILLNSAKNERDFAILMTLLDTGLRVGELASLTRDRLKPNALIVNGKVGERVVPVSSNVYQLLIRQGDEEHLWIGPRGRLTRGGLQQIVRRCMRDAGFRPPKIGPHMLRHTFGVQYMMNGGDMFSLQRILGHKKVDTTMIYVEMSNLDGCRAASKIFSHARSGR